MNFTPASSNQSFPSAWAAEAIGDILHNDINDLRQGRGAGGIKKNILWFHFSAAAAVKVC
jgi:hypothetical protein